MRRFLLVPAVVVGIVSSVHGDPIRVFTLRELAGKASVIVRAEPVGPLDARKFSVKEVLQGSGLRPGDTVTLENIASWETKSLEAQALKREKAPPLRFVEVLLFLRSIDATREHPSEVVPSGLRLLREDGIVFGPDPATWSHGSAPSLDNLPKPQPGISWGDLLVMVRADCAELRPLASRRALSPARGRNRGILAWIREHRHEFNSANGWDSLEGDLFTEVLTTATPVEGWAAVQLFAQLHEGALPALPGPIFGNTAGRNLLLVLAASEERLPGDRERALRLLAHPQAMWPTTARDSSAALPPKGEQQEIIDRLTPLLKHRDSGLCGAAARAMLIAARPDNPELSDRRLDMPVEALTGAYKAAAAGAGRNELAAVLREAGGVKHWQTVSANTHGILARIEDYSHDSSTIRFCLQYASDGVRLHEPPVAVLELLNSGKVIQKKEQPLVVRLKSVSWTDGWSGEFLPLDFAHPALEAGSWRLTVKGTAGKGKDRVTWTSEPQTLVVPPARGPGYPAVTTDW
jgi:hypothetical protein